MSKVFILFLLIFLGLLSASCQTDWYKKENVNFTKVGDVGDKCHENEERVKTSIVPITVVEGTNRVYVEACVQKDAMNTYLDNMQKLKESVLKIDPVSLSIFADQVEMLVKEDMKANGKDKIGDDVPRVYKVELYVWETH